MEKIKLYPDHRAKDNIIKILSQCQSAGLRTSEIYQDFLDIAHDTLVMLPAHAASLVKDKVLSQDTPEIAERFARLKKRYGDPRYFGYFQQAFNVLVKSADDGWEDVIGDVYMEFGNPNSHSGQFFTPWHVSALMAQITMSDDIVWKHLEDAYRKSAVGRMHALVGGEERISAFVRELGPGVLNVIDIEQFEPVTVCDPAVGSGVMLLAIASVLPVWMHSLVKFYGMDIDQQCVTMCRVNMMLHGLNGFGIKCALALSGAELAALPEPYADAYSEAQVATPERLIEITSEVKSWKQNALI